MVYGHEKVLESSMLFNLKVVDPESVCCVHHFTLTLLYATSFNLRIIMLFFRFEDERIIDFLIEKGASVNETLKSSTSPLHLAVSYGRVKVVKLLIKAEAHVNARDESLNTPLHMIKNMTVRSYPCFPTPADHYAIVNLLIQNGAEVRAKNADGKMPLDLATNEESKFSI